jgi:hypothetical protein
MQYITNPEVVAEVFNSYLVKIVEQLAKQNMQDDKVKIKYMFRHHIHKVCIRR